MNTATDSQSSQLETDKRKMKTSIEPFDYMWEKEVERDLLLLLQTWHADCVVNEYQKNHNKALLKELLEVHSEAFQQPVYFPFAGKTENALGDAIAKAGGLYLIECKTVINSSAWTREAKPEIKTPNAQDSTKITVSNKGGKNRLAQLTAVEAALNKDKENRARNIANQCHVLIGAASEAKHLGPSSLRFIWYWDFIMSNGKPEIDLKELSELQEGNVSFQDFRDYVFALLKNRSSDTGTQRLLNQMIVLVKDGDSWHGSRVTDQVLSLALKRAVKVTKEAQQDALKKAAIADHKKRRSLGGNV